MASPLSGRRRFGGPFHYGRGSEPKFCRVSSPSSHFLSDSPDYFRFSRRSSFGFYPRLAPERVCQRISSSHSSSLFKDVFCSQGSHRQETHNRPFSFEQTPEESEVQNGGFREGGQIPYSGALGSQAGPKGCLSTSSFGRANREVFWLCPGEKDLCLPSSPFWSLPSSLAFHQGYKTCEESLTSIGGEDFVFPGRFPDLGPISRGSYSPYQTHYRSPPTPGFPHQLEKVSFGSPEEVRIPWGGSRFGGHDFLPSRGEGGKTSLPGPGVGKAIYQTVGSRESGGFSGLCSHLPSFRSAVAQTTSVMDELPLVSSVSSRADKDRRCLSGGHQSLGSQILSGGVCSSSSGQSLSGLDDGRLSVGLGRCGSPFSSTGDLGCRSKVQVHELVGAESYPAVSASLPSSTDRPLCVLEIGQRDGSLLHQEARVLDFSSSLEPVSGDFGSRLAVENSSCSSTPEGGPECSGGQSLKRHSYLHGVVSRRNFISDSLRRAGYSSGGSDGNLGKRETVQVCVSLPGQESLRDRRFFLRLESLGINLSVPSIPASSGGCAQAGVLPGQGVPCCSPMALSPVVSPASVQVSPQTAAQGGSHSFPMDFSGRGFPSRDRHLPAARLDFMRNSLLNDGFSMAAVDYFLNCHKASTKTQYQSTWSRFLSFLESENVCPSDVRLCHVHNFLAKEALENCRAYRTVATYKCALSLPLKICLGLDLDNIHTRKFMMGIWNGNPPKPKPMPSWDLSQLLLFLRSDLFEDLHEVSFSLLTQKVLVLLLIATGRRISEIANLSRCTSVVGDRTYIQWLPDFRAKWCSGHSGFVPHSPSVLKMDTVSDRHRRNCPVRALNIFLERRCLVVNRQNNDCFWTLSQSGLASTFRSVVRASLEHADAPLNVSIYPHQTKKFAVSYCWKYFASQLVSDKLPALTGNCSVRVLKSTYLGSVPDIKVHCVVPLGTIFSSPSSLG